MSKPTEMLECAAAERSGLIREFIDTIERSDVIVHVEVLATPDDYQILGATRFTVWAGGVRFLRVQVESHRRPLLDQIATLGHELFHVIEVARAPQVTDPAGFGRVYREIGYQWTRDRFETEGARAAERRVVAEMFGYRSMPRVHAAPEGGRFDPGRVKTP